MTVTETVLPTETENEVALARFDVELLAPGSGQLRAWQSEAMPIVLGALKDEPVLVEACPGAGKTQFGLEIAYRMVTAGEISIPLLGSPSSSSIMRKRATLTT